MHMKSISGLVVERLGHKASNESVSCSNGADGALHTNHLIRKQHNVITRSWSSHPLSLAAVIIVYSPDT